MNLRDISRKSSRRNEPAVGDDFGRVSGVVVITVILHNDRYHKRNKMSPTVLVYVFRLRIELLSSLSH